MYKGKLGIALISFYRHWYFRKLIKSLENQTYVENTDFHLFNEGSRNWKNNKLRAEQADIDESVSVFEKSKLPNKNYHISDKQYGVAIHQFKACEYMADKYDYVLVIEDDVILSPHYLQLVRAMIDQFMDNPEVFGVSAHFLRQCKESEIPKYLNKAGFMESHWWAFCFSSAKWNQMRPYFLEYYEYVKNIDYKERPNAEIRKFFSDNGFIKQQTSQDAGKDYALWKAGLKRINTYVNRGMYTGIRGEHANPTLMAKYEVDKQKPYIFESDKDLTQFELIG